MKRGIEVNGPASIKMLMQIETDKADKLENGEEIIYMSKETYDSVLEQCDLLIKYMKAYADAVNNNEPAPFWHEMKHK